MTTLTTFPTSPRETGANGTYSLFENILLYEGDNPINTVDPTGLAAWQREWFIDHDKPAKQDSIASGFFDKYGQMITLASEKYCVPRRLLATIIFNEWIDVPQTVYTPAQWLESFVSDSGGNGLAQIHLSTATIEDAIDPGAFAAWYKDHSTGFLSGTPVSSYADYIAANPTLTWKYGRDYLQTDAGNIDTSANLLKKYMNKLCVASRNGTLGAGFISSFGTGRNADFCGCDGKNCKEIVNLNIEALALVKPLAAMWNNGAGAMSAAAVDPHSNMFLNADQAHMIWYILGRQAWWK